MQSNTSVESQKRGVGKWAQDAFVQMEELATLGGILSAKLDTENTTKRHIAEVVMDKLMTKALQKIGNMAGEEKVETNKSFMQFASDVRRISSSAKSLGGINYHIARLMGWQNPAFTFSSLLLYTFLCLHPNFVLTLPIAGLLLGVMVPGYSHRHPFPAQLLPEDPVLKVEAVETVSEVEAKNLMSAFGDVQNSVGEIVKLLDGVDHFYYGAGSFADESHSAAVYLLLTLSAISIAYISRFLPVTPGLIIGGWSVVLLNHPLIKDKAKQFKQEYIKKHEKDLELFVKAFEEHEIIHSALPVIEEVRDVEIFELERQGLTPRMWDPWLYTCDLYDFGSEARSCGERPLGCILMENVRPPQGWHFDEEHPWVLDPDTKGWIINRGVRDVETEQDGEWAYDYNPAEGERGEWRRRRWIRACFRGALAPREQSN